MSSPAAAGQTTTDQLAGGSVLLMDRACYHPYTLGAVAGPPTPPGTLRGRSARRSSSRYESIPSGVVWRGERTAHHRQQGNSPMCPMSRPSALSVVVLLAFVTACRGADHAVQGVTFGTLPGQGVFAVRPAELPRQALVGRHPSAHGDVRRRRAVRVPTGTRGSLSLCPRRRSHFLDGTTGQTRPSARLVSDRRPLRRHGVHPGSGCRCAGDPGIRGRETLVSGASSRRGSVGRGRAGLDHHRSPKASSPRNS